MHERDDILVAQPVETDRLAPARRLQLVDQVRQRVADIGLGVACGADHQEARGLRGAQHVGEQRDRGAVGPVCVVDDEHDRPRRRTRAQPRADRLEQAVLLGLAGRGDSRADPGQPRPDLRREAGQRFRIDAEGRRELIILEVADVPPERLDDGLERSGHELVAAPEHHERAGGVGLRRHFRRQSRLPDARFSKHPQRVRLLDLGGERDRGKLDAPASIARSHRTEHAGRGSGRPLSSSIPISSNSCPPRPRASILTISEHRI